MNWGEIKRQCLQLGFMKERDYLKNREAFFSSANWAQNQIALYVRPILKKQVINSRFPKNVIENGENAKKTVLYEGEPLKYKSLWARAFSFEADGNGVCKIEDDDGEREISLSSDGTFKSYRGFCKGRLKLVFTGPYGYLVRNVSAYGILFSDREEDIPVASDYVSYDFKKIDERFMGFADKKPTWQGNSPEGERDFADYKLEGDSVMKIKGDKRGQFEVWYKIYPPLINVDTSDEYTLPFEDAACEIIPYLMGFRLFLEDDIQRAVIYQNTAEDLMGKLISTGFAGTYPRAFIDTEDGLWLN